MEFRLKQGLMYGDEPQYDVVLRDLTTGDLIDAEIASEQLSSDKQGNPLLMVGKFYLVMSYYVAKLPVLVNYKVHFLLHNCVRSHLKT